MNRSLLIILLLFLLVNCGGSSGGGDDSRALSTNACPVLGLNTRVINGTECGENSSPIVRISILLRNGNLGLCSGTLLTSRDVLTAAHCFFGDTFGANVEVNGRTVNASEVVIHPGVTIDTNTLTVINDAAIVRLAEPLSGPTLPILGSRSASGGDIVSIFGYGLDNNGIADVLRSGEMRVSNVTENHVLAAFNGEGSNTCNGDSGGPAIYTFTNDAGSEFDAITGIVSSGELITCLEGDTTYFTNTQRSSVLDFITQTVPGVGIV